jgi:hypothetical protein
MHADERFLVNKLRSRYKPFLCGHQLVRPLPLLNPGNGSLAAPPEKATALCPCGATVTSDALPLLHVGSGKVEMPLSRVGSGQKC